MLNLITTRQYDLEEQKEYERHLNLVENQVLQYQSSIWEGYTYVTDDTYNTCLQYLNLLNKNSPLLRNDKEVIFIEDLDDDTRAVLNGVVPEDIDTLTFMLKPQGVNLKLKYEYGELKEAKTFGRSLGEVDIVEKVKRFLGDRNDNLEEIEVVNLEGVLTLPYSNLDIANELFNIQDTYTGVFAILKAENIEEIYGVEEIYDLLHFICTDIHFEGLDEDLPDRKSRLEYASETYFLTISECESFEIEGNLLNTVDNAIYQFDTDYSDYDYKTEGVQLILDETEYIVIVKTGKWKKQNFRGTIKEIKWVDSKETKIPVLILEEGIQVESDKIINEIPLKSINLLLILEVEVGNIIQFNYLGDIGIVPITKTNDLLFTA